MARMPSVPENSPGVMTRATDEDASSADSPTFNDYDRFAEAYSTESDAGIQNAYYERPAILALAGDVTGRKILDAGCGSGPLFAALRDRGAIVTGVDKSAGMIEQARRRLGAGADLGVADLAEPLPFADDSFDDVVASLVLHYLEDWGPTLTEFRRVLKTGGRLITAVDHPMATTALELLAGRPTTYLATYRWTEEWAMGGQTAQMSFWHRPMHAMTDAFTVADFRISVLSEPQPVPEAREIDPDGFRMLSNNPSFLFFVLHAE
jgi:ubiquinone/menaquinone biosynthesis C-methylase UbiE